MRPRPRAGGGGGEGRGGGRQQMEAGHNGVRQMQPQRAADVCARTYTRVRAHTSTHTPAEKQKIRALNLKLMHFHW